MEGDGEHEYVCDTSWSCGARDFEISTIKGHRNIDSNLSRIKICNVSFIF